MTAIARLSKRGVVSVAGAERVSFLNGLGSNDVARAGPGRAVWAALLTPQGRYISDFFIFAESDRLLLDLPAGRLAETLLRLKRFRLRAEVTLDDLSPSLSVFAAWSGAPPSVAVCAPDPRLDAAGYRMISSTPLAETASEEAYDAHRLALGLPDGPPYL
jgi:folate-binding Fe-S cluster repair protein YgfZ